MKYKFDEFNTREEKVLIAVIEEVKNGDTLSGLFNSSHDYDNHEYWIESVEKVLSGKSEHEELGVEGFFVDVYPDRTEVEFEFEENLDLAVAEIPTSVFREILIEWFKELKKFKEQYDM